MTDRLRLVAERLGTLKEDAVFLGGAVAPLLITDPAALHIRPTDDVDLIVRTATRRAYYDVEEALRDRGFVHDLSDGAPICRWITPDGIRVDVMPTDASLLGFGNRWYDLAIKTAQAYSLGGGLYIWLIAAPAFIGTKLEAFKSRGAADYLASHDLEDVVAVLDGRPELADEVQRSPDDLRTYLSAEFGHLLSNPGFQEALQGHVAQGAATSGRVKIVQERMTRIAGG